MDNKQTIFKTDTHGTLGTDAEYFKYIFKKTEKIVCAVFYILRANKDTDTKDTLVKAVEQDAYELMDRAHKGLGVAYAYRERHVEDLSFSLVGLESKLRILMAAQLLRPDLFEVFAHEIDTVLRTLKRYRQIDLSNPLLVEDAPLPTRPQKREGEFAVRRGERVSHRGVSTTSDQGSVATQPLAIAQGRRSRILEIIKDKGEATIKDISEQVTDCSEKTIQRELIDLIKDNSIVRKGERRWSKYSLSV